MDLGSWLQDNWQELLAFTGLGSASGIAGKKLADKRQDAQIKSLKSRVEKAEVGISTNSIEIGLIKKDLETNTKFDKQLRDDLVEHRAIIQETLKEIKENQKEQMGYIMELLRR